MVTEIKGGIRYGRAEVLQMLRRTRGGTQDTPGRWV